MNFISRPKITGNRQINATYSVYRTVIAKLCCARHVHQNSWKGRPKDEELAAMLSEGPRLPKSREHAGEPEIAAVACVLGGREEKESETSQRHLSVQLPSLVHTTHKYRANPSWPNHAAHPWRLLQARAFPSICGA